jgi:CBS-domain-containing membrane protein
MLKRSIAAAIYVGAAAMLTHFSGAPATAMTFASTSVLLATLPSTDAAKPRAVIGGHVLAALSGWIVGVWLGPSGYAACLAIGLAAFAMQATRTLHPPAAVSGYLMLNQSGHWSWIIAPIVLGSVALSALACLMDRLGLTTVEPGKS